MSDLLYPTFEAAMRAKGHTPIMEDDGELNVWVRSGGYHNGPGCETCGWSCCYHCTDEADIPECTSGLIEGELVRKALPA